MWSLPEIPLILVAHDWRSYRLIDSGNARKLEEVGGYRFIRPEPQALWRPDLDSKAWSDVSGEFIPSSSDHDNGGRWSLSPDLPEQWSVEYDDIRFYARPTPFRHLGFFPEQSSHWRWCDEMIRARYTASGVAPTMLNLFAYSGVASLHAARAGAEVTHVDASKKAIALAFANRDLAEMTSSPIRYITDDARAFVAREARRGRSYDMIVLDPPKYGRGPKGEVWQIEDNIADLLDEARRLLSEKPLCVVVTSYAIRMSFLALHHLLEDMTQGLGGKVSSGELALGEDRDGGRILGQAIFARWHAG